MFPGARIKKNTYTLLSVRIQTGATVLGAVYWLSESFEKTTPLSFSFFKIDLCHLIFFIFLFNLWILKIDVKGVTASY